MPQVSEKRAVSPGKDLHTARDKIKALTSDSESCLNRQHEEGLLELRSELRSVRGELRAMDLKEGNEVTALHSKLEEIMFQCSIDIKRLLQGETRPTTSFDSSSMKLPKLDVPMFDGNILNWQTFWEQFCISVHGRPNSEKLVYFHRAKQEILQLVNCIPFCQYV